MFTGIIRLHGQLAHCERPGRWYIQIPAGYTQQTGWNIGDSIAVDGICLTIADHTPQGFSVDISPETQACTAVGTWHTGQIVHLEPALRMGDPVGGHWITGHVDTVGVLDNRAPDGDAIRLTIGLPVQWGKYLAPKGSVALNGVSLTINTSGRCPQDPSRYQIGICLIPHTQRETQFIHYPIGGPVHVEIDPMARYMVHCLETMHG